MGNMDDVIKARSEASAKRASQLPPSTQYAICQVVPNMLSGVFWAFTDMADIKEHFEALKSDQNITARKLQNACLIEVNPQYLMKAVMLVDPNLLVQQDLNNIQVSMASAKMDFEKFLIKGCKQASPFAGTVGIYCVNEVTTIVYKGVTYPAFRLSMGDALYLLDHYGYNVKVKGQLYPAMQAMKLGQNLWESTVLSPTKTGIFISIAATLNAEQVKPLEAEYKTRYGIGKK